MWEVYGSSADSRDRQQRMTSRWAAAQHFALNGRSLAVRGADSGHRVIRPPEMRACKLSFTARGRPMEFGSKADAGNCPPQLGLDTQMDIK